MNSKLIWTVLLIGFAGVNIYAFTTATSGDFMHYLSNLGPWGILASVDLVLALFIGIAWMWQDAKNKGINPLPYTVLTLLTGSIGLLVYLVRFGADTNPAHTVAAE
ncbi:hypothetical protein [Kordiimonas sp. SCSIO 12610]|uniref:hypothetical protein n=1 Tax=Kordiimonas sp. SCSIO 12610 TaxID=2829597 RepID=UPI0021090C16|nr:hypothetical protein [Kordiimonas sp. SCSIO 12610]UTW56549.1 hypothetical protein KFF44_06525 [Kordiimonas sp. SCSIO 12610]